MIEIDKLIKLGFGYRGDGLWTYNPNNKCRNVMAVSRCEGRDDIFVVFDFALLELPTINEIRDFIRRYESNDL